MKRRLEIKLIEAAVWQHRTGVRNRLSISCVGTPKKGLPERWYRNRRKASRIYEERELKSRLSRICGSLGVSKLYGPPFSLIGSNILLSTFICDRLCGLVVRVLGYTTVMYCVSCEVRTEFIYVM
jgi:hypothetical protein